jgi:hypothetical protein
VLSIVEHHHEIRQSDAFPPIEEGWGSKNLNPLIYWFFKGYFLNQVLELVVIF